MGKLKETSESAVFATVKKLSLDIKASRWKLAQIFFHVRCIAKWSVEKQYELGKAANIGRSQFIRYSCAQELVLKQSTEKERQELMMHSPDRVYRELIMKKGAGTYKGGPTPSPITGDEYRKAREEARKKAIDEVDRIYAETPSSKEDPYTALYLTPGAPEKLVRIVYEFLMEESEDEEERNEYREAFEALAKRQGWEIVGNEIW